MPTTWRCGAAPRPCSAPTRSRSRFPPARRRRSCSTSPPRSSPTAPSRPTRCKAATCPRAGWSIRTTASRSPIRARSAEGLLLPIGGYKGSGLALVLGLLAGTLNGAAFGRDVIDFNSDDSGAQHRPFHHRARRRALHAARRVQGGGRPPPARRCGIRKRLPGFDAIRLPGERRRPLPAERRKNGVPICPAGDRRSSTRLAGELGVKRLRARL